MKDETKLCEMHSELSTRYSDAQFWKPDVDIMVVGLGNIGSWLTLLLSKLEPRMILYDMDTVETHNIGVSAYQMDDVGKLKTVAADNMIHRSSNIHAEALEGIYDDEGMTCPITFIGTDNMTAREKAFDMWVEDHGEDPEAIFIDGRSTMEFIQTYNVVGGNKDAIEAYRKTLFSDNEDIGELPCGSKSSSHFGAIIAGYMVTAYTNHLSNIFLNFNVKVIPFSTTFNGLPFQLETEVAYGQ